MFYNYKKDDLGNESLKILGLPVFRVFETNTCRKVKVFGVTVAKAATKRENFITADIYYLAPNHRLDKKKVLITGGGSGIGAAIASRFIAEGAEVCIAGRNEARLKEVATELGCKYIVMDVSDTSVAMQSLQAADTMMGGLNVLVNNAGVTAPEGSILDSNPESWDSQLSTNLKGAYFLSQKFISLHIEEKRTNSSILFISSVRGIFSDDTPYGLSKAAINSLTQGLAWRYAPHGIRVNAICPGVTLTEMVKHDCNRTSDSSPNLYYKHNSGERYFLPEEVAEAACFLTCDASNCITGLILPCDYGGTLNTAWMHLKP